MDTRAGAVRRVPAAPPDLPGRAAPWDRREDRTDWAAHFREPTRFVDAVLGLGVLFAWAPPGVPPSFSVGLLAVAALAGLAMLRRPRWSTEVRSRLGWLLPTLVLLVGYLAVVSIITPDESLYGWDRRAVRLVLVMVFFVALVSGRIHLPSLLRGVIAGLGANTVLFYAGVAPANYGSFLSGFLLDKNQAGLAYAVIGLLAIGLAESRSRQVAVVAVAGGLVWLTGSRTSLAAFACGVAWFVLRPRLEVTGRILLATVVAVVVRVLETDFARVGVFADREGTDWFRARIDEASQVKLDASPWYGRGLGESWVQLETGQYLFHNSYWAALVEGGWPLALAYIAVTVLVGVGLLRTTRVDAPWVGAAEAANVAVLICALRLGEVFGATAATIVLATGVLAHLATSAAGEQRPGTWSPRVLRDGEA
ncbi:ABC transporter permease [Phycicoccus sp. CSK15P-2]|uniref:ABC transporter permease n=1 Tax=Phycicoccus sp. CSK15P-2 TaxID=2807627 RepID=UPI001950EF65|nr:ABC transporter permease [Phycicoccus sp. CSK15P-2]MBM6404273.1 ABC transporter permease [Phycicoccus sp. CSK15P-2]